jgi:hypothetical protein
MKLIEGADVSFEEWHAIAKKQIQEIRASRTLHSAFLLFRRNLMNSPSGF